MWPKTAWWRKAYPAGSPVNVEDEIEAVDNEIESLQTLISLKDSYAADPGQLDQNAEKQMLTLLRELRSGEEKGRQNGPAGAAVYPQ